MQIRVSYPEALPELVSALSERAHFVVGAVGPDVVTVGVLGSFKDGGEDDLRRFLGQWQVGWPDIEVDVEIDELGTVTVLPIPLRFA